MILLLLNFALVMLISFTVLAIYLRRAASGKRMQTRLKTIHVTSAGAADTAVVALEVTEQKGRAARVIQHLRRAPFGGRIEKLLLEADSPMTVLTAAIVSGSAAVVAGLLCFFTVHILPVVLVAFLLGSIAPYGAVLWQRASRLNAFNAELPGALDLMTRALRAGHAMSSAIELVGIESAPPLGPEFASVFQQQKLGVRFRDALLEMSKRIPSQDLHFVITAILIQRETGGDVTEVLERTTHVIRERARIAAEVKTRTAQGKLTGWILALLPIAMLLLINLVSPGYSHILFHDPLGQKLLSAGAIFIIIGGLLIRKIVDVRV